MVYITISPGCLGVRISLSPDFYLVIFEKLGFNKKGMVWFGMVRRGSIAVRVSWFSGRTSY